MTVSCRGVHLLELESEGSVMAEDPRKKRSRIRESPPLKSDGRTSGTKERVLKSSCTVVQFEEGPTYFLTVRGETGTKVIPGTI